MAAPLFVIQEDHDHDTGHDEASMEADIKNRPLSLSQPQVAASFLPEGAFWLVSLSRYETGGCELPQSSPGGDASSLGEGAFWPDSLLWYGTG